MTYGTPERFVEALNATAKKFEKAAKPIQALPTLRDLRIALNVAAADMRPLVIIRGKDAVESTSLAKRVATCAWSKEAIGTSHYVILNEEVTFEGLTPKLGITVVQPDPFGLGGELLSHHLPTATQKAVLKTLTEGVAKHEALARDHDDHVREARRKGINWETEVPVTDTKGGREKRGG